MLYIGCHEENWIARGKTDTDPEIEEHFGAAICTQRWLSYPWANEYFTLGHELGHILHLDHNDDDEIDDFMYGGYGEGNFNILFEFSLQFPDKFHYDDSELDAMNFIERFSADN